MTTLTPSLRFIAAAALLVLSGELAVAAELRFHYVPVDARGNTTLQPKGGVGEKVQWMGLVRKPSNNQPRPTHLVTFRHPYTGGLITVPLALPEGTPRLEYRRNRIVYNFGSYTVEAQFLPDGSVDVVYNSGLFRDL
jgi:hypothetical protein